MRKKYNSSYSETRTKFLSKNTLCEILKLFQPKTKMTNWDKNSKILSILKSVYLLVKFVCSQKCQSTWFRTLKLWASSLQPQSALRLWQKYQSKTWFAKILLSELKNFIFLAQTTSKNLFISSITLVLKSVGFMLNNKSNFLKVWSDFRKKLLWELEEWDLIRLT